MQHRQHQQNIGYIYFIPANWMRSSIDGRNRWREQQQCARSSSSLSLSLYPLSLSLSPPLCLSLSVSPLLLEFKLMWHSTRSKTVTIFHCHNKRIVNSMTLIVYGVPYVCPPIKQNWIECDFSASFHSVSEPNSIFAFDWSKRFPPYGIFIYLNFICTRIWFHFSIRIIHRE